MKIRTPQIAKTILKKKIKVGGLTAQLQRYSSQDNTQQKENQIDQWNKIVKNRNKPSCLQLTDLRGITRQLNGQRMVSSTNGTATTGYPHAKNDVRLPISGHMQKLTQNG